MKQMYRAVGMFVPGAMRKKIKVLLSYAGFKKDQENLIGFSIVISVLLGLLIGFIMGILLKRSFLLFAIAGIVFVGIVMYLLLNLMVDKKARLVESYLPDVLQLMSSNLRAGMTPDKALFMSARPEFGILKGEIDAVGRKVALGKSIGAALLEMAQNIKSTRLLRAVELINSGLDSGGSLGNLLDATSQHLEEQLLIDKKIGASITMYIIFIFSAASMISPILFGLSSFLADVMKNVISQLDIPSSSSLPLTVTEVQLSSSFMITFILTFLIANCLMASLILGQMGSGKKRAGLKYFIPMAALAIPLFLLARYAIQSLLSGLLNM